MIRGLKYIILHLKWGFPVLKSLLFIMKAAEEETGACYDCSKRNHHLPFELYLSSRPCFSVHYISITNPWEMRQKHSVIT